MISRRTRRVVGLAAVVIAIQFVGPRPTNSTVDASLALPEGAVPGHVRQVLRRACYDCHSDETRWPWYSRVALASWLVIADVNDGRSQLNFSRWGRYNSFDRADLLDKACELASKREMPLLQYRIVRGAAALSEQDIAALCAWTQEESARLMGTGN